MHSQWSSLKSRGELKFPSPSDPHITTNEINQEDIDRLEKEITGEIEGDTGADMEQDVKIENKNITDQFNDLGQQIAGNHGKKMNEKYRKPPRYVLQPTYWDLFVRGLKKGVKGKPIF